MSHHTDLNLVGRVAVVTGAQGRLGGHFCEFLLEAGARVAAIDRCDAAISAHVRALNERYGAEILRSFSADVTRRAELDAVAAKIQTQFGDVAILVNNAGIDQPPDAHAGATLLEDVAAAPSLKILEVNLLGAFQCCQAFLPPLRRSGRGSIVNIGSLYASVAPDPRFYDHLGLEPPFLKPPLYGPSKAGLVNLTKYLATHLGPTGVRVNTLSPGGVAGGQDPSFVDKFCARVPLGRMAQPRDLAGPLLFLAGSASEYMTGAELVVDGGFTAW